MHRFYSIFVAMLLAPFASADLINGGFDQGLAGWEITGGGGNYYRADDPNETRIPFPFPVTDNPAFQAWEIRDDGLAGTHSARVISGGYAYNSYNFIGPDGVNYMFDSEFSPRFWMGLFQDVSMSAGQKLFGWARFGTAEAGVEFADRSRILINGQIIWDAELEDVWGRPEYEFAEDRWQSEWQLWEFTAPSTGTYRLQLELEVDDQLTSWADFDGIELSGLLGGSDNSSVPETGGTLLLLAMGLAALELHRKLRRQRRC